MDRGKPASAEALRDDMSVAEGRSLARRAEQKETLPPAGTLAVVAAALAVLAGLYVVSIHHYLLFHSLAELFSIAVACAVFMIVWNARRFLDNTYLLFIGIAFLFVAGLDLLHMLAYKGMGVFEGGRSTNLAAQLWVAARYVEALSLLLATAFIGRKLKVHAVFGAYAAACALVVLSIFRWHIFPVCFVEGQGLTAFKKDSEYAICLVLVWAIVAVYRHRERFERRVLRLIVWTIVSTIAGELAFTLYADAYGLFNLVGHYLKILSFYLIYRALIQTGLMKPYGLLFRDLKQREEALRESEERLRRAFDQSPIGAAVVGLDGRYLQVNEALCRILGHSAAELTRLTVRDVSQPEDFEVDQAQARRLAAGEIDGYQMDKRYVRKDGTILWARLSHRLMRDADGRPLHFLPMVEDITARKRAEQELERTVAELRRSNSDLEQYARVASHDLQSPLIVLAGYAKLLERRYMGRLDPEADTYLANIREGVSRMDELIRDVLAYSRVESRGGRSFEPTHCSAVVDAALANLRAELERAGAVVTRDPLPTVMADGHQLGQVFQNLVSNAVKFRGERRPEVHIGAEARDRDWLFFVRDNGIGIPPESRERVFDMFERLHGKSEYPGTGIGLAICRKIVERHGGRIWVESEPQKGSTFYFTIPQASREGAFAPAQPGGVSTSSSAPSRTH